MVTTLFSLCSTSFVTSLVTFTLACLMLFVGTFDDSALDVIADYAWQANETAENIGARRLHTLLEMILNDIAFNAGGGDAPEVEVKVDAEYVRNQLSEEIQSKDVKKYIL